MIFNVSKMFNKFARIALQDIASQYGMPMKGITGSLLTRYNANKTRFLEHAAFDALNCTEDDCILEIGFGRGEGIAYAYDKVKSGGGIVFGIDWSPYITELAQKRFVLEIAEEAKIKVDQIFELRNLPYPTDFFSGVFHVDTFYFWQQDAMVEICHEIYRVLKPGASLTCGLQLSRLKKLQKWGILTESQSDPTRYLLCLEPAGFSSVQMTYHRSKEGSEYQLISGKKPYSSEQTSDYDTVMEELEKEIKRDLLVEQVLKTRRPPSSVDVTLSPPDVKS
ncbi:hypothetical protein AB6A40_004708 [Gnathostoma spinigerum]|uniref:Methyltransferase domain-containing protein n=1 Tax=Gnathostoma spinigerum TaxID=75299 RepID=A0ABD6EDA2_9BILA